MFDIKLKTKDKNNMEFVRVRCLTPEIGALPRWHHRGELRHFYTFARATPARRRAKLQLYER